MFSLLLVIAMMWACDAVLPIQPLSITPSEFDIVNSTGDSYGMNIKVPTAYFKAVLVLTNGNRTGGAYWTPHVGYSSNDTDLDISIDDLENKIGIDLYVNLPRKIGDSAAAAIEADRPGNSKWWE